MKKLLLAMLAIGFVGSTLCVQQDAQFDDYISWKNNPNIINTNSGKKYLVQFVGTAKTGTKPNIKPSVVNYQGQQYKLDKQCSNAGCGVTNCPWINQGTIACGAVSALSNVYNYTELN